MGIESGIIETEEIPGITFGKGKKRRLFIECFDDEGHNMPKGNREAKQDAIAFAEFVKQVVGGKTQDKLILRPPFRMGPN